MEVEAKIVEEVAEIMGTTARANSKRDHFTTRAQLQRDNSLPAKSAVQQVPSSYSIPKVSFKHCLFGLS